jgi:hypothetical protein
MVVIGALVKFAEDVVGRFSTSVNGLGRNRQGLRRTDDTH